MLRPSQEALVARRIGAVELGLFAQRSYLARQGTPKDWDGMKGHTVIGFDQENAFIRGLRKQIGALRREAFALRTDSDLAQLAAIRAGYGIGACQVGLAKRDAGLVRVLPKLFKLELDTWLTMHEDLRESARCRVSFAALAAGLARYVGA